MKIKGTRKKRSFHHETNLNINLSNIKLNHLIFLINFLHPTLVQEKSSSKDFAMTESFNNNTKKKKIVAFHRHSASSIKAKGMEKGHNFLRAKDSTKEKERNQLQRQFPFEIKLAFFSLSSYQ